MKIICPFCKQPPRAFSGARTLSRAGRFWRKSDGHWISRFSCRRCKKTFSTATLLPNYRQKKRHKNEAVRRELCAGVSQREAARVLNLNRKTIVRKLLYLSQRAKTELPQTNSNHPASLQVEFDDLETFEHSKHKPLSVTLMVEHRTRRILGFEVSQMPAKGRFAQYSRKKYGRRPDERRQGRQRLFEKLQELVHPHALIRSDSNPHYVQDVKKYFPKALHQSIKGQRGAVTGQGELKKGKFDPLFSLNHTFAMLRSHLSRLIRKTWCTTKKKERLEAHLYIYALMHNQRLSTA